MATKKESTKKTPAKKVFTFKSDNPYLICEGCQFIKGEYKTKDKTIADVLRQYPQIKEA